MITAAIFWLLNRPLLLAVILGALILGPYYTGTLIGARQERSEAELRNTKATNKQLQQRGQINEDVNNDDIADTCIELGGLPEQCNDQ